MLMTQSATTGILSSWARGNQGINLIDTGCLSEESWGEISGVVRDYADVLKNNQEELNKFRKKVYLQIQKQASS